jgi:HD superfamily phosphohydrolase
MPTWGFSPAMRQARPWGLPGSFTRPGKTITDPVHQDIYLTEAEATILAAPALQRLRHVKQLGTTFTVYPGAEHSRFTHLLGTVAAAQKILDKIYSSSDGPHSKVSLLAEWREAEIFDHKWAEATVLARLAALLHDLTHVPFGHTIEDDLNVLVPHDKNEDRFNTMWKTLPDEVRKPIEQAETTRPHADRMTSLFDELKVIVLDKMSRDEDTPRSSYPFVADVVNNTICADLLDYIARDHRFLGLPFAVGDRFMDNFYVVPSYERSTYAEHLVVRLVRDGERRVDVRTELLKYLRYRYEETERALYHKTKLAYDAMLGKMLEMWKDTIWYGLATMDDVALRQHPRALDASWLRSAVANPGPRGNAPGRSVAELDTQVEAELERHFEFFGDEGLLEHIVWTLREKRDASGLDEREEGILELARRIRYRDHYRLLGQASGPSVLGVAEEKYRAFGSADARRTLERQAAKFAGIDPAWQVVLWIPGPRMRLKIAEVLVQQEDGLIRPLARALPSDTDHATGDEDAALIVQRHMQLWALRVYGARSIRDNSEKCNRLLAYLKQELGLPLVRWDGAEVRDLATLAAEEINDKRRDKWSAAEVQTLADEIRQRAARGDYERFEDLLDDNGDGPSSLGDWTGDIG